MTDHVQSNVKEATEVEKAARKPGRPAKANSNVSQEVIEEMRARAKTRKEEEAKVAAEASDKDVDIWIYNSRSQNIMQVPKSMVLIEDGMYLYEPPSNLPISEENKDVHIELAKEGIGTTYIDGKVNAQKIRSNTEESLKLSVHQPIKPMMMNDDQLIEVGAMV